MTGQSTLQSITPAIGTTTPSGLIAAQKMGLVRGGRPLKRWRYVGVFNEQLMACAALVQVGAARQSFWAIYLRDTGELYERTRLLPRRRELQLEQGRLLLHDRDITLTLELVEDDGWEAHCPNGRQHVWTRKQAGIAARGTLKIGDEPARPIDASAVIDDTAGYHSRHTEWWWSAGVGVAPDGSALAWNLVSGVNDPDSGSERAVWVQGEPHEVAPVSFDPNLRRIDTGDGSVLHFRAEAERSHSQNMLLVKSDYRAPFGSLSGTLPGGISLAHGLGVVEHHRALW